MDQLNLVMYAWAQLSWVFTVWLPSWWEALEADVNYIRHIGD
jgi:hypothetical protein